MLFHLDLIEGTITHYCGSLNGTLNSGLNSMFNPRPMFTPFSQQTLRTSPTPQRTDDPEKNICDFIFKLISGAIENSMIMQHLLVDLKQIVGRKQTILPKSRNGLMHPIQAMKFQQLNDGHKMCLKCLCDFFSYSDATQKH